MSAQERYKKIKEILQQAAQSGQSEIDRAIASNDFYVRPTEGAEGVGLLAALEASSVASEPTEEEVRRFKKTMYGDENSNLPAVIPTVIPGTVRNIAGTRTGKLLGLTEGMPEDEVVRKAVEMGFGGTGLAHGKIIRDSFKTDNLRKIADQATESVPGLKKTLIAESPEEWRILTAKNKKNPESAGFADLNQGIIGVDASTLNNDPASTLLHEIRHQLDKSKYSVDQLNKMPNEGIFTAEKEKALKKLLSPAKMRGLVDDKNQFNVDALSDVYNDLILKGDPVKASSLENAYKLNHIGGYKNYELDNFIERLIQNYSENLNPQDMQFIKEVSPRVFKKTIRKPPLGSE